MFRELVRQALSITIREGLGISVRDGTLGETGGETSGEVVHLAFVERVDRNGSWQVKLFKLKEEPSSAEMAEIGNDTPIWKHDWTWIQTVRVLTKMTQVSKSRRRMNS